MPTRGDKLIEWLESIDEPEVDRADLGEAIYTINEEGIWGNYYEVELESESVIRSWKLVEKLRQERLPKEFML